ncbi:MAG TPA: diiron oxygenase [Acidimicrobiales bacterium]|jgi:hypothetical protein|nr:diiron oxygenase [Acidimicrobiales bacterium]
MTITEPKATGSEPAPRVDSTFVSMVERLSRQSVEKHSDAYADIDWDAEVNRVDAADPRWSLWPDDPLATSEWYQAQSPEMKSRIALQRVATAMRVGLQFENLLQRGLLLHAFHLPNHSPEYRYLHHEVIEESQHSLMFQELINRTGLNVGGMPRAFRAAASLVFPSLNQRFRALFFMFVLGGEDPVDHLQRQQLRVGVTHPLVEQIMRIHVTEEARHVSFARHYLIKEVPELGWLHRHVLAVAAPLLFVVMGRLMVWPSRQMAHDIGMPIAEWRRVVHSPECRRLLADSLTKPRKLCRQLGLDGPVARFLWRITGGGALPRNAA